MPLFLHPIFPYDRQHKHVSQHHKGIDRKEALW
jgi:hypothetical protein